MYQNRRLNWNIQWGQTGISLAVCLLVEYCCGSLRKLLRGYICPGLSRSKEWIEKKSYFKNCFYNQIYKNIFIKENIRSKYMPIYIENNKVMLKDKFKKIKIEHFTQVYLDVCHIQWFYLDLKTIQFLVIYCFKVLIC